MVHQRVWEKCLVDLLEVKGTKRDGSSRNRADRTTAARDTFVTSRPGTEMVEVLERRQHSVADMVQLL